MAGGFFTELSVTLYMLCSMLLFVMLYKFDAFGACTELSRITISGGMLNDMFSCFSVLRFAKI